MSRAIDTGAMLSQRHGTDSGRAVRLRMAHQRDAAGLRALLARRGVPDGDMEIERLVRHDPRTSAVICALAWDGRAEIVVGLGAIALEPGAEPHALVSDEDAAPGVGALLWAALQDRARRRASRAARRVA